MNYICRNCGKIITEKQYAKENKIRETAQSLGCFIWLIILLCFCSLILIPIALILIGAVYQKEPKFECPYCTAKDSLIPLDTPIAQKLLNDNYSQEEIERIFKQTAEEKQQEIEQNKIKDAEEEEKKEKSRKLWFKIAIIIIILYILGFICEKFI